jgi:hypothetical protein
MRKDAQERPIGISSRGTYWRPADLATLIGLPAPSNDSGLGADDTWKFSNTARWSNNVRIIYASLSRCLRMYNV